MIVSSGIRACSFFFRTGDCESALFALLFAHSLFWHMHWLARRKTNDKTQLSASFPGGMKRLNSLHPSLGAWKKPKKKKNNPMSEAFWPSRSSWFFFCFLFFLFFLLFFVSFGFPAFPQINFFLRTSLCLFPHVGMKEPFVNNKKNLKRDLSELKIKIISFFWGWLGWKPFFLNLLNSKA